MAGGLCWHWGREHSLMLLVQYWLLFPCGGPDSFMRGVSSCPACDSFCQLLEQLRCRRRSLVRAVAGQRSEAGGSGHAVGCLPRGLEEEEMGRG